ncbi:hypothetical protein PBI_FLOOF_56 [Microbacterium phage Floof]|uniref:Uncharacterized protein n=1 Tax=Microbacterium phage Floof TaxID=2201433 RepID=A0A2Z4Q467_9CAUD|nr:hypothetical protein PBI_FLOOF_56 [Microbacterium phage Floof]
MPAPIVHAFDRKPLSVEKLADAADRFDYFGGISVVIGSGKTVTPGQLWERVAEGTTKRERARTSRLIRAGRRPIRLRNEGPRP